MNTLRPILAAQAPPRPTPQFAIGEKVVKVGEYSATGIVRAAFTLSNGALFYAVEHRAELAGVYVTLYRPMELRARE